MKVIVPAKQSSSRVINKNFRPFDGDQSLVDITINKLKSSGFRASDIYVSSESAKDLFPLKAKYGCQTLVRDVSLCNNSTPMTKVIRSLCGQIGGWREIAIAHVTTPTFDEYRSCLDMWRTQRGDHDSLSVAFESDKFMMMRSGERFNPCGWSFGSLHASSQMIDPFYVYPFCFSILTRKSLEETSWYVGRDPLWFVSRSKHHDIDSMEDFLDAQAVYSRRKLRTMQQTDQRNKKQLVRR